METGFISLRYELLLMLGLLIMVVFLLIIVTFSWMQQKKKGKQEKKQFNAQIEYQQKLHEVRTLHAEKERFRFVHALQQETDILHTAASGLAGISRKAGTEFGQKLHELSGRIENAAKQVESVAREIAPALLLESGLLDALGSLVQQYNSEGKADLYLMGKGYKKQDDFVEIMFFRIAAEIISNALKHGKPNRIDIELQGKEGAVILEIRDNGLPFDLKKRLSDHSITAPGNGLRDIESRLHGNAELIYSHADGMNRNQISWTEKTS